MVLLKKTYLTNKYISLKEIDELTNKYKKVLRKTFKNIMTLKYFLFKYKYHYLKRKMIKQNNHFIANEMKNTTILNNINGYSLDNEQKRAVITDEDSYLIVAGAGSGKTLTMIGKIKYLIERLKVNPEHILCISFTNFTTESFKKALQKQNIRNVDVFTFHKLSLEIIKQNKKIIHIAPTNLLDCLIKNFWKNDLLKDFTLLKNFIENYVINSSVHLNNLCIYDEEEIIISNFLFFCKVKYSYKCIGYYKKAHFAFYLEDYNIYIKHFNLEKDSLDDIENIKELLHFTVLETYSQMFTENTIFDIIKQFLDANNVVIKNPDYQKIYEIFCYKGNKIENLSKTILTFINMFKSGNHPFSKFDEIEKQLMKNKTNQKYLIILEIIKRIYILYQTSLNQNHELDFNDMINLATTIINNNEVILKYKYIIIDEFQDTSYSRYKLIKAIKQQKECKLVAVGDDFQSIYRFTGCDVNMFINFTTFFPFSKILYLTNTYRNSMELITVAGSFIMKNKAQIQKKLTSKKSNPKPIKIYFYKDKQEITSLFKQIKEENVFVLGRNNSDINFFQNTSFMIQDDNIIYGNKKIKFMSVHKSKGLESDAVVIVNLEDKTLGFPSKCEDDILISYLNNYKVYYPYDEERRLFYVALTRTKNNVYLFVPCKNKSLFVEEILKEHKNFIEFIN